MKSALSHVILSCFTLAMVAGCRVQNNPPELTGLTPRQAYVGEEAVLKGYQFGTDPAVLFSNSETSLAASILSHDDNTIRVRIPLIAPGPARVQVRTDEGTSDPLPFVVQQPSPSVATITPGNGLPGTAVVIAGNYLNQLIRVRFNEAGAAIKDSSAQKLTVTVPTNAPRGPLSIIIETAGGQTTFPFIVAGTPTITAVSPISVRAGGDLLIQGTNLTDGVVRVNGLAIFREQTTIKDTEIRARVPDNATSGPVTVTVFDKLVATSPQPVQVVRQPVLANLSSREGIQGDKVLLNGFNLSTVSGVLFNATPAPFRVISDTQLEATVPALPAPASVTVTLSGVGGNFAENNAFFFYTIPGAITVNPARQLRERAITITGPNLHRIQEVRVSGQPVPITGRVEGSELTVNVPGNAVSGPVTVTNRAGTATTARPLVVIQKPVITDIIPKVARPGERVVLRGDFLLNAQIVFTGTTAPAADGGRNEDTERWVLVPTDAQTGPLRITNATNDPTTTELFTVLRVVTNVDFSPKTAKVGDELVITGTNLASVQDVRFNNGALAATRFTLSNNTIRVTVPTGAITGQICLINGAGTTCTSANFTISR